MIYSPASLAFLLLLFFLLAFVFALVELRILAYAYRKIGIASRHVFALLLLTLVGSHVNIPLYSLPVEQFVPAEEVLLFGRVYQVPPTVHEGTTVVAINVGGALIPALVSVYLLHRFRLYRPTVLAVAVVALVVNRLAQVVPGVGIVVPMFLPPLLAAAVSLLLAYRHAPAVAYVSGSMGALLGADVYNLWKVVELGAPVVSIGGAGTFDGVFLTGILAGLLA